MKSPRIQIGVMGGAFVYNKKALNYAYCVGKNLAQRNCTLVTGATTGIPHAAVLGAADHGGFSIGISPAKDFVEHVERYKKPIEGLDVIVYTGMGFNGREPLNINSCDGLIYIGGEFGTLIEFGQGFYEGKILGVLKGVGGISDKIEKILSYMSSHYDSKIIYDSNPENLVNKVISAVKKRKKSLRNIEKKVQNFGRDVKRLLERKE